MHAINTTLYISTWIELNWIQALSFKHENGFGRVYFFKMFMYADSYTEHHAKAKE